MIFSNQNPIIISWLNTFQKAKIYMTIWFSINKNFAKNKLEIYGKIFLLDSKLCMTWEFIIEISNYKMWFTFRFRKEPKSSTLVWQLAFLTLKELLVAQCSCLLKYLATKSILTSVTFGHLGLSFIVWSLEVRPIRIIQLKRPFWKRWN